MVFRGLPKPEWLISKRAASLSWPSIIAGTTAVVFGVIVTGAGPHAGDINTPRNGLDIEIWQHYHSYPGYIMLGLIALQLLAQLRTDRSFRNLATRSLTLLMGASVIQAGIGIIQSRLGVPPLLVGAHMLGAAVIISLLSFQLLTLRSRGE
jgi:heme a synthase